MSKREVVREALLHGRPPYVPWSFVKAVVLCIDAVKMILFEGADIESELSEKLYYLKMLCYG